MKPHTLISLALTCLLLVAVAGCTAPDASSEATPPTTSTLTQAGPLTFVATTSTIPYRTTAAVSLSGICDCSANKYNCPDFPLSNGATGQDCYDYCLSQGKGDVHKLDRDNNQRACES